MKRLILFGFLIQSIALFSQGKVHELIESARKKDERRAYSDALKDLEEALKLSARKNDTVLYLHGKVSLEMDDPKTASKDLTEIFSHTKSYAEAYCLRGQIKMKQREHAQAIADFDEAIKLMPVHPEAFYFRGLCYAFIDKIKEAMQDFSMAIDQKNDHALAYYNRGYWKDLMGDKKGALEDIRNAKKYDPENDDIVLELATLLYQNGSKEEACKELQKVVDKGNLTAEEMQRTFCN